ncbi:hypothetical protein RA27_17745 [Ruegeria sp. ANG-R]|nr:hypothetical protein RA27_17745 [Ruegeria sp. ANG-R]
MTVSNYVNGHFDLLSDKMKERVSKSIKELNYRRNFGAHVLRTSQLWSIGLIIVDRSDEFLADGYTTQITSGFSNYLNNNGYSLLLQGVKPEEFENSNIVRNLQTDAIGVLFSGDDAARQSQFELICELSQPTVLFLEDFENSTHKLCSIKQDEIAGGSQLAGAVLKYSPKHVAILTSGENEWAAVNKRIAGMRRALDQAGVVDRIFTVPCGDTSFGDVSVSLERHVRDHGLPDAVMCINDYIAMSAITLLKRRGVDVPGRTCVTGFNAFQLHQMSDPTITTMQSPAYEMGQAGAKALLDCLDSDGFSDRVITFPGILVQGESA